MRRYYFNFRKGDLVARDHIGMHLPNLNAARDEALCTWGDILAIAAATGESSCDCEIQITDDSGETVLSIPQKNTEKQRLH